MKSKKFYNIITVFLVIFIFTACENQETISLSGEAGEESTDWVDQENVSVPEGIYVYVSGAVKNPGVYELKEGSRIYEAIEAAGGMTDKAKKDYLNLAEPVSDGERIDVLTKKEYKEMTSEIKDNVNSEDKVNINSATSEELQSLSGIGETKAVAIIKYREENGRFAAIEDIMNVSGIGDATFEQIKSSITID